MDQHGWPVRRRVTLTSRDGAVTIRNGGREPVRLWQDVVRLDIDYLLAYGARERWVRTWISSASVPTALRLRVTRREAADTLLVVIGERG